MTWNTTNLSDSASTTTTFVVYARDVPRLWFEPRSAEEERREAFQREVEALLVLRAARRKRHAELVRVLALAERAPRPRTAREPAQRPKTRSTSGSERWRVRNPNS